MKMSGVVNYDISEVFNITTCLTFPEKIILDELMSIYETMK